MNPIFPNFNFDIWLTEFHSIFISFDNSTWVEDRDNLQDAKYLFDNQVHFDMEDTWCGACEYLRALTRFNRFMALFTKK